MDIQGADEVSAIVIDIGSFNSKAGFAGEDSPNSIVPSYVGVIGVDNDNDHKENNDLMDISEDNSNSNELIKKMGESNKKVQYYVGEKSLNFVRNNMELENVMVEVVNWDHAERLIGFLEKERLGVDSREHPIIISEVSYNNQKNREKMVEILFERFEHPAVFLGKSPVLASFASGKATSLVVDSGAGVTCCSPVYDGYVLTKGIVRSPYAGNWLTEQVLNYYANKNVPFRADYMFEKRRQNDKSIKIEPKDFSLVSKSYSKWRTTNIVNDFKHQLFFISHNPLYKDAQVSVKQEVFELPDGTKVQIGPERVTLPEMFFSPSSILEIQQQFQKKPFTNENNTPISFPSSQQKLDVKGIHILADEAIKRCELDIRKELYNNIILSGGNTTIQGFKERFEREIISKTPISVRTKSPVSYVLNSQDRIYNTWIGGSILASLGSFQQMWASKELYKEHGSSIVNRCFP